MSGSQVRSAVMEAYCDTVGAQSMVYWWIFTMAAMISSGPQA